MDDIAYMFLGAADDVDEQATEAAQPDSHDGTPTSPRKRRGIRDFLSKANLQDQLLDKLFQQVIPVDRSSARDGPDNSELYYGSDGTTEDEDGGVRKAEAKAEAAAAAAAAAAADRPKAPRPGFSVAIMSNNFRRFNARIGVVFRFQKRVERLLGWRQPSHTLVLLGVYTLVCLDPYLLTLLPSAVLLLGVLIPGFIARHPGTPSTNTPTLVLPAENYARGPPLAPPRTMQPVKELSRAFFRNMGDLQNSMEDFSVAHDNIVRTVVPATNFSDEAFSSALFVLLCAVAIFLSLFAHVLPWRALLLIGGWVTIGSGHPAAARQLRVWKSRSASAAAAAAAAAASARRTKDKAPAITSASHGAPGKVSRMIAVPPTTTATATAAINPTSTTITDLSSSPVSLWNAWVASDIILDEPPEMREVEIFELQRRSASAAEWEPWVFSPSPFDPLSQPRLQGHGAGAGGSSPAGGPVSGSSAAASVSAGGGGGGHPTGARFFEDVLPPPGWEWSEKKWALDLWSRDWVEERIITGVEVETEGERWVYDIRNSQHDLRAAAAVAEDDEADALAYDGEGGGDFYTTRSGLQPPPKSFRPVRRPLGSSWEEGEEGMGRRGEWRRRRWVRTVKRKKITTTA